MKIYWSAEFTLAAQLMNVFWLPAFVFHGVIVVSLTYTANPASAACIFAKSLAMNTKRKTIAIDMDGVIADTVSQFILWYEKDFGVRIPKDSFEGKPEIEGLPDKAVRKYVYTPGFFRTVPVMEGAKEAVLELMKNFDIYIVSAAMEFPQSLFEKYEWLQEHFPIIKWNNIIFCGDKSIIGTDYIIDDHVRNLDGFKGKTLMFTAGHNAGIDRHTRVNNWKEVITALNKELKEE